MDTTPLPDFPIAYERPVSAEFFARSPAAVAPELLGCVLVSTAGEALTAGIIVETEAYLGSDDPGSHAATRGMTRRNSVMYGPPGTVYVYFTYGNHHMINLVCDREGVAGAVLVRALEPVAGIDIMTVRRGGRAILELCSGPGKTAQALGVDLSDNATALGAGRLQVYHGATQQGRRIRTSGRIGLREGHELALRFYYEDSRFVSRGRAGAAMPRRRAPGNDREGDV